MNISKAKEDVKNTILCYLTKDEFGRYEISPKEQRPIFLMGPPGVGKTDIMAQVASELNIGLLTYSMTHHTRQSALGLPIIKKKIYKGKEYDVSEYTMSEIIASIHDMIEETGQENGILFLDEINCVSETLSPIMLRFLQYKEFGKDTVPAGWVVVTAGNPPEYNNSVHEFDIVTWDRLKRIDIEPDFEAWKKYAYESEVHPAIITYLDSKKHNFYSIEQTVDGKKFVTARGWTDLSKMIKLYEKHKLAVDKDLVAQYIHNEKIARDFAIYLDLYRKYKTDYNIQDILNGTYSEDILERSQNAAYDEKFTLVGLLIEALGDDAKRIVRDNEVLVNLMHKLSDLKNVNQPENIFKTIEGMIDEITNDITRKKSSNSLSEKEENTYLYTQKLLKRYFDAAKKLPDSPPYEAIRTAFNIDAAKHRNDCEKVKRHYVNAFKFGDEAFGDDSQQMLIICTEMVANTNISMYIATKGCEPYFAHDDLLMFHKRNVEIIKELGDLEALENI